MPPPSTTATNHGELTDDQLLSEIEAYLGESPVSAGLDEEELMLQESSHHRKTFEFVDTLSIPLRPSALPKTSTRDLERGVLSLGSGLAIIVATTIGSGIFTSPGIVFGYTKSVGAALLIWITSGVLATTGALCYAELGALIPESGGDFSYLMHAYGSLPAFLFGWTGILLTRPGSTAIIALTFADYFCGILGWSGPVLVKMVASVCIFIVCILNIFSSKAAIIAQNVLSFLKVFSLVLISASGASYLFTRFNQIPQNIFASSSIHPGDYALATYSALWAYDGWNSLNLVTGEMKNPEKNLPRAVTGGPLLIMVCYVFTNLAYFAVVAPSIVMSSNTIALEFGRIVFGSLGGTIIPLIVIISCLSSVHANIFSGSRVVWVI
jgi:amino acid transporter